MLQKTPRPDAARRMLKKLERARRAIENGTDTIRKGLEFGAPKRKRPSKWNHESRLLLFQEVARLTRDRLTEREACRRLARDPKKLALFPYAEQKGRHDRAGFQSRAAEALRRQLHNFINSFPMDRRKLLRRHLTGKYTFKALGEN